MIQQHAIRYRPFAELSTAPCRRQELAASVCETLIVEFIDVEHSARNLVAQAARRPNGKPAPVAANEAVRQVKRCGNVESTIPDWPAARLTRSFRASDTEPATGSRQKQTSPACLHSIFIRHAYRHAIWKALRLSFDGSCG
jgi:cell pole-organizing protein PopZ